MLYTTAQNTVQCQVALSYASQLLQQRTSTASSAIRCTICTAPAFPPSSDVPQCGGLMAHAALWIIRSIGSIGSPLLADLLAHSNTRHPIKLTRLISPVSPVIAVPSWPLPSSSLCPLNPISDYAREEFQPRLMCKSREALINNAFFRRLYG
jgi:hypothetical protein